MGASGTDPEANGRGVADSHVLGVSHDALRRLRSARILLGNIIAALHPLLCRYLL